FCAFRCCFFLTFFPLGCQHCLHCGHVCIALTSFVVPARPFMLSVPAILSESPFKFGSEPEQLFHPRDVAANVADGEVYVSESAKHRSSVFDVNGNPLRA